MTASILDKTAFRVNWVVLQQRARIFGIVAISFAAGGWVASIRDEASTIPYKDRSTAQLEQVKKVAGANPVAAVKCLKRQSAVAVGVANQAVANSYGDNVPIPSLTAIPDCPTPKTAK